MDFSLSTYYPIFLYVAIILAFAVANLVLAHVIGPRRKTPVKLMPYESGMDPVGSTRQHFDVKFYLVAIMFLVFDVELLFLYPWAVAAYYAPGEPVEPLIPLAMADAVFWGVLVFIALLGVGFVYDWRKGVFKWR